MITATHLLTAQNGAGASSYVTASASLSANKLVLLEVGHQIASGGNVAQPTVTGANRTWTLVKTKLDYTGNRRISVFRSLAASADSGALTIDFGGQSQVRAGWSINEFGGIDTGGTNGASAIVQSVSNDITDGAAATGMSVTLAAFSSTNNATYGAIRQGGAGPITQGSGFTELGEADGSASYETEFRSDNATTVDWSWASATTISMAIAAELKAASTGSNQGLTTLGIG